jgi:CRISPR-associated protein Csb3
MSESTEPVQVRVDVTNPGHYFACCGLLEVAERLNPGCKGWFDLGNFRIDCELGLSDLLSCVQKFKLDGQDTNCAEADDSESEDANDDDDASLVPIVVVSPIKLHLDWWAQKSLKTWAGSMDERAIFLAMCGAIDPKSGDPMNQSQVVYEQISNHAGGRSRKPKKREPFYFDSRRGYNSNSVDVGFSSDAQKIFVHSNPVVEALSFIGLQRCRPAPTDEPRVFDYHVWSVPREIILLPAAIAGLLPDSRARCYQFENWFRTSQRKHKAFLSAKPKPTSH